MDSSIGCFALTKSVCMGESVVCIGESVQYYLPAKDNDQYSEVCIHVFIYHTYHIVFNVLNCQMFVLYCSALY